MLTIGRLIRVSHLKRLKKRCLVEGFYLHQRPEHSSDFRVQDSEWSDSIV